MKVQFTETVVRDAQQSLIATRMPFSDFEDILETMDNAGYHSIECWGGATFDSCLRFLDEDPWERLRKIKAICKKTPLQMLLRGQNILGYKHYPDDVVRLFVRKSAENGMDIFRIFDALNDFRNIEVAVDETLKCGKHAQGCICYTTSPVHTVEKYAEMGKELEKMGVNSICIKDMAGICGPQEAYDLVKALKASVKVPIYFHTHHTTGLGPMTYLKAIEAGLDGIDTAISPMAGGTSQPATETMKYALEQLGYETDLDSAALKKIADHFAPIKDRFLKEGILNPKSMGIRTDILEYQLPGGMFSNRKKVNTAAPGAAVFFIKYQNKLLFSRFHVIAAVLADRALIICREFRTVERFKVTADLADKALLLFHLHRWNVFEGIFSMLAERADIIIR